MTQYRMAAKCPSFPVCVQLTDQPSPWAPDKNNAPDQQTIVITVYEHTICFVQPVRRRIILTPDDGTKPYEAHTTDEAELPFYTLYIDNTDLTASVTTHDWIEGRITLADVEARARNLVYEAMASSADFRAAMAEHYPEFAKWYDRSFGTQVIMERTLIRTARLLSCAWRSSLRIQGAPPILTPNNVDERLVHETLYDLKNCLETAHNILANAPKHTPVWWQTLMGATLAILEGERERLEQVAAAMKVHDVLAGAAVGGTKRLSI